MIKQAPILITGIPRSGATMIAAAINLCGAFGGSMSKRGMFSNDRIREEVIKPYLISMGADKEGLASFPMHLSIPINMQELVEKIIIEEGYIKGAWMYKDSRNILLWKLWEYAYPHAKWIIVRRRTGDILESCMHTKYMTAYNTKEGWLEMVHKYESNLSEMINEGLNCKVIWPERMVQGNYDQLYELCEWLGLQWNPEALKYIDTLLWGNKQKERSK